MEMVNFTLMVFLFDLAEYLPRLLYFFPLAFVFLGGWQLMTALTAYLSRRAFLEIANRTEGRVVLNEEERRGKKVRYRPQITFNTMDGKTIVFVAEMPSDEPEFEVGELVELYYDPMTPEMAIPARFWHLWFWPVFNGTLGTLMFTLGVYLTFSFQEALGPVW
jgi:hypothetical protein